MAEATTTTATPAAIDYDKLAAAMGAAMAPAIGTAVAEAVKPLGDAVAKLQAPAAPAEGAATAKKDEAKPAAGLTLEELTRVLDERDQKRTQSVEIKQKRDAFLGEKLKDVPPAYRDLLGTDPAAWEAEAPKIRERFVSEAAAAGLKGTAVGGPAADATGAKPGDVTSSPLKTANGLSDGEAKFAASIKLPTT